MKLIRNAFAAGLAVAAVSVVACSSQHGSTGAGPGSNGGPGNTGIVGETGTGSVGMHLNLAPGVTLTTVHWVITGGPSGNPGYSGDVAIGDAGSLEFIAGGILAGSGYVLTITGTDSSGDPCTGTSSSFTIVAGAVTQTFLQVTCTAPGAEGGVVASTVNTGSVEIDAGVVYVVGDAGQTITCPAISSFSISPAEINLSGSAALTLQTVGASNPTITWSVSPAGGGSFGNASAASTTFACSGTAAQVSITATVGLPGSSACSGQPFTVFPVPGNPQTQALVNCEIGGTTVPDSGPPVEAGPAEAGPVEAGPVEAGPVEAGPVDSGGATACVGGTSNVCAASNPVCTNGLTQGIGTPSGGCNQTESTILASEGESCLECLLNFSCLHDQQGDNPSTNHPDCDDLSGTVPADAGAGAGTSLVSDCISLLTCELNSKCGKGNTLDCYCGIGVNSTTCKTSQTGACVTQEQVGLESTDPNYIQANATALANVNGGATANVILNCAKNNCDTVCFQ
jgi:hypothetical protein